MSHADMVIESVTDICRQAGAESVILFGSRATGYAVEKSDIDIAVKAADVDSIAEKVERIPTLLSINLVDEAAASPLLKKDIDSYGKLLYKA
jgi:predicted nucleotidyltransferase